MEIKKDWITPKKYNPGNVVILLSHLKSNLQYLCVCGMWTFSSFYIFNFVFFLFWIVFLPYMVVEPFYWWDLSKTHLKSLSSRGKSKKWKKLFWIPFFFFLISKNFVLTKSKRNSFCIQKRDPKLIHCM